MMIETPEAVSPLMRKFQAVYELFSQFSYDTAEFHENLPVHDDASRAVYNSLSRVVAFTDQMNILMSLMREDVRVIDELASSPVMASRSDQVERCFREWLRSPKNAASNVN